MPRRNVSFGPLLENSISFSRAVKKELAFEIVKAVKDDLPSILSLYAQRDMDNGQTLSLEQAESIFAKMQTYPDYKIYVAVAKNEIIGTFALLIMHNLAHMGALSGVIEDVVVHEHWQGKGIGKNMMHFAMKLCEEKHCYKLVLSSNIKRKAAHEFYESLGFKKHGYSFSVEYD